MWHGRPPCTDQPPPPPLFSLFSISFPPRHLENTWRCNNTTRLYYKIKINLFFTTNELPCSQRHLADDVGATRTSDSAQTAICCRVCWSTRVLCLRLNKILINRKKQGAYALQITVLRTTINSINLYEWRNRMFISINIKISSYRYNAPYSYYLYLSFF